MTTCDETIVWQTIENMRHLGLAVNSFYSVLGKKLEESFTKCKPLDSETEELIQGEWCCFSTCRSYTLNILKPKNKIKQPCPLSVRTELWREVDHTGNSDWKHAKTPLIYIGFSPDKGDPWVEEYLKLDMWGSPTMYEVDDGKIVEPTTDGNLWLWEWQSEYNDNNKWSERSWFFAIPLLDISSATDIQEQILDPLKSLLLNNKSPENSFEGKKAITNS